MNIHIETDRLIIRDLEYDDIEGMFKLDSDPEVHRFLGNKPIKTMEEAKKGIEYVRSQYEKNRIGRWAVIDKATGDFIGWSGLKYEEHVRDFPYYDIGYRFRREYWGKGIATESALASLKYGFEKLELEEIGGAADVNHAASLKILERIGLKYVDEFTYDGELCKWLKIGREEWLNNFNIPGASDK